MDVGLPRDRVAQHQPSAERATTRTQPATEEVEPVRALSLVDELFGPPDDDETDTVELPRGRDDA
jgi:uncharacterized MAPEG superfamily protein